MKVKYSVIPFVPAFLAMMFLKMMSIVGMDSHGQFMGMNSMNITGVVMEPSADIGKWDRICVAACRSARVRSPSAACIRSSIAAAGSINPHLS